MPCNSISYAMHYAPNNMKLGIQIAIVFLARGVCRLAPGALTRPGAPKPLIPLKFPGVLGVPGLFFNPYGMGFIWAHQWGAATASSYRYVFFISIWITFLVDSLDSLSLIKRKGNKNKGLRVPGKCAG